MRSNGILESQYPNILSTNWKVCLSFVFSVVAIAQVFTIHFIMHAWVCVHVYFHHMLSSWFRLKSFIKISMCAKLQRIYVRLLWLQSTFAGRTKSHNELCAAAGNSSFVWFYPDYTVKSTAHGILLFVNHTFPSIKRQSIIISISSGLLLNCFNWVSTFQQTSQRFSRDFSSNEFTTKLEMCSWPPGNTLI